MGSRRRAHAQSLSDAERQSRLAWRISGGPTGQWQADVATTALDWRSVHRVGNGSAATQTQRGGGRRPSGEVASGASGSETLDC